MEQFLQILLMVVVVYATVALAVRTMLAEHTRFIAVLTAMLVVSLWCLISTL